MKLRKLVVMVSIVVMVFATGKTFGQTSTWLGNSGNWSDTTTPSGVWSGGVPADGTDNTANFTGVNIAANKTITNNTIRTIGNITFTDATTSHDLTISGANTLTLDVSSGSPVIDVTQSGRTLTISSPIAGNDGLQKNGAGILLLSNTSNNYTGGTVHNAGTISFGTNSDVYLGHTSGGLTFNGGQITYLDDFVLNRNVTVNGNFQLTNRIRVNGVLSGDGPITQSGSDGATFANTGNTFTGSITSGYAMTFASLGDSANAITLANNGWSWTGGAKTFALRPFTLTGTGTSSLTSDGSGALVIQQSLAFSSIGATKTLQLGGSYTASANTFAGSITNGTGSTVSLAKGTDASIWALSGTNTYTGATTLPVVAGTTAASGAFIFQGIQALSPATSLRAVSSSANSGKVPGTFNILDDSASPESRSGVNLFWSGANGQDPLTIFVGNNNTANGGTSAGTTTGSTIQLGNMSFTQTSGSTAGLILAVTGSNGYKLQIANVSISVPSYTGAWNTKLNTTTAPLTVAGNVQQVAGGTGTVNLQLDGTATANLISGNIMDSADGIPKVLTLSKDGTGTWTLSGSNSYTGATSINAGALRFTTGSGTRCASAVTIANTAGCIFGVNLAAANGQWASSSNLTVAGLNSAIEIDFGATAVSTTVDPIQVTTLTVNGVGTLRILSSDLSQFVPENTYPLINGTTSVPAPADPYSGLTLVLPTGVTGKLVTVDKHVNLFISGNTVKSWNSGNANWDTDTPWTLAGTPAAFAANDTVYLGDSPSVSGNPTITVSGTSVSPTAVIMHSANHDYTIAGNAIATGTVTVNSPSRTLTLSSTNTYSGATTITKGTLRAGVATVPATSGAFGNTSPVTLANDATAVLDLNGFNNTIASLSGGGSFGGNVVLGSATLTTGGGTTYAGVISGSGGLTKAGSGTLILTGVNTFTGGITINSGTLQIGNAGSTSALGGGNYAGNILNNGILDIQSGVNHTLSGVISGSGSLFKKYNGTLTLSGANTYTGKTTLGGFVNSVTPILVVSSFNSVNGGTPLLASSSLGCPTNVANGTIELGSNNSNPNPVLRYIGTGETTDRVINFTFNQGSYRTLNASGSGLLKFTSAFTSSGASSGGLMLDGSGSGEITQALPNLPNLEKNGTGTWTLGGAIANTGTIKVSGGTLNLNAANATGFGTGAIAVTGGTLNLNGTNAISTRPLTISGSGRVNANAPYALGSCAITNSATLALTVDLSLMSTNRLTIAGSGKVQLDTGVRAKVGLLTLATTSQALGTYGSTASTAAIKNDTYFSGSGVLFVGVDFPPAGTLIQFK